MIDGRAEVSFPASDRGLLYGHGLFETMRLCQGELPLLDLHLSRLQAGASVLAIACDPLDIKAQLDRALSRFPSKGVVKLVLTAGDGLRGYRYDSHISTLSPRCLIQYSEQPAAMNKIKLQVCEYRLPHNPVLAGIKHLNRLDQVMAALELSGNSDGLLLDQVGNVIEALSSNIFILSGGQWLTPSLINSGVAGVMRQFLLDNVMPALGISTLCRDIDPNVLAQADEVFICNAVRGIASVTGIAGLTEGSHNSEQRVYDRPQYTPLINAELRKQKPCFAD